MPNPGHAPPRRNRGTRRHHWTRLLLLGGVLAALNIMVYLALTPAVIEHLGRFGYASAVGVTAAANATVIVPIPYFPIIARLGQVFSPWGIVMAAAAGSAIGESVAYYVGRAGRGAVAETHGYRWLRRHMHPHWRASMTLFLLSAPPNPAFDVAGLLAGAGGLPFWLFWLSVCLGRMIRMGLVVFIGAGLAGP